jgi:hypothetical protein
LRFELDNIINLFCKYLVDIRSEAWRKSFLGIDNWKNCLQCTEEHKPTENTECWEHFFT